MVAAATHLDRRLRWHRHRRDRAPRPSPSTAPTASPAWYKTQFDAFTKETGIAVNLVEAGSGEVVSRVEKEQSNPQADLVVTLPPFIQKADAQGLLQPSGIDTSARPRGPSRTRPASTCRWSTTTSRSSPTRARTRRPTTWDDLLTEQYKGKLQYSTPGQAGDGTAVLLLLQHLMGKPGALDYLGKLQANNVGPSSSTGKLQPKVSNGELLVANGDVQMNLASINDDGSKFDIFFPADADGNRTTVALPYVMGLAKGAPHAEQAKKLMEFLLSETGAEDRRTRRARRLRPRPIRNPRATFDRQGHPGRAARRRHRLDARLEQRPRRTRRRHRRLPEGHRELTWPTESAPGHRARPSTGTAARPTHSAPPAITFDRVNVAYGRGQGATRA